MTHWLVTFNSKGIIETCGHSTLECSPGKSMLLVKAETKSSACAMARALYNAASRVRVAHQRERWKSNGQCSKCGRERHDEEFSTCRTCRHRSRNYQLKEPTGKRDEVARVVELHKTKRNHRDELGLEVLLNVRHAFENSRTMGQFAKWLADEIRRVDRSGNVG